MWLLPIVFMIHEFEEIIFLNSWITKNKEYIHQRLPQIAKIFLSRLEKMSTPAFALAVFEEFILLSALTFICVEFKYFSLFAALSIAYLVHVIVHIIQSIALKKYIPAVGTGIITGLYNVFALYYLNLLDLLNWKTIAFLTPLVAFIAFLNLLFCHYLAKLFDDTKNKG